jgi:hypothetical protein
MITDTVDFLARSHRRSARLDADIPQRVYQRVYRFVRDEEGLEADLESFYLPESEGIGPRQRDHGE